MCPEEWYNGQLVYFRTSGYKLLNKIIKNRLPNKVDFYQSVEQESFATDAAP